MLFNELIDSLQNLIRIRPSQQNIADILGVKQGAISNRIMRGSHLKFEELRKIENAYGIVGGLTGEFVSASDDCFIFNHLDNSSNKLQIDKKVITLSDNKNIFWLNANGDSMSPVIENQDIVLVDTSNADISNGGIFLFEINAKRFVKRLRLRVTGELDIISDNEKYPPEVITNCSQLKVIGRVIKNLSKGL